MLAKGHCANTVRHLMNDQRSIDAVDAAIDFGNNKISIEELNVFAGYAYAAASTAASTASAAASAAYTASDVAAYAASAADAAAYASAAYAAADAAAYASAASAAADTSASAASASAASASAFFNTTKKSNQLLTADICRKYLPCPTI